MKDVSSTSFGLLISFLLPGLAGLYSLTFWSPGLNTAFETFTTAQANVGLFFLVILASLIVGLQVTALRWLLFERWFPKIHWLGMSEPLQAHEFAALGGTTKLEAFRATVDEHYRYHQFWGGMAIDIPLLYAGWCHAFRPSNGALILSIVLFCAMECLTITAALEAARRYVDRARTILGG